MLLNLLYIGGVGVWSLPIESDKATVLLEGGHERPVIALTLTLTQTLTQTPALTQTLA